ncbi:MAG: hypothetical protein HYT87_13855 [Nitrospirae bacterium]|nr:hypothetical protein [Nitrospirota bacterium]
MVQVDVFWSYALGAGFAVAASRQLLKEREENNGTPFRNAFFMKTLFFLAVFFVPSGAYLLWAFPDWETMQVARSRDDLPAWLVTLFTTTNVTQGILGFFVAYTLIMKRKLYAAFLQLIAGYFCMFFILVHGWDGAGYKRFFSSNHEKFLNWQGSNVTDWFTSDVAITLAVMGVIMMPLLFGWMAKWQRSGYKLDSSVDQARAARMSQGRVIRIVSGAMFLASLGAAIVSSLLIHWLGWILGGAVAIMVIYALGISRWGVFHFYYRKLMLVNA